MQIIKAVSIREGLKENFFVVGDVEDGGVYDLCKVEKIDVQDVRDERFVVITLRSNSGKIFTVNQPFRLVNQLDIIDDADSEEWDKRLAAFRVVVEEHRASRPQ